MKVREFMKTDLITVDPKTPIMEAQKIMSEKKIKRLPVMKKDKLVGLVTKHMLLEATPSSATSLSVYELNYLLSKMTVDEIMVKDPITIPPDYPVEAAIWLGKKHGIGAFPVMDDGKLVGIITESDIFGALIEIMGVGEGGTRLSLDLEHKPGILAGAIEIIKEHGTNMLSIVSGPSETGENRRTIVIRLETKDATAIVRELEDKGYAVSATVEEAKGQA